MPSEDSANIISIPHIFDRAQRNIANHKKGIQNLLKLQQKDPAQFTREFIYELRKCLIVQKKEPSVELIIIFTTQFAVTTTIPAEFDEVEQDFSMLLLTFILQLANSKNQAVRFRSTQIISKIINSMPQDAEWDENIYSNLLEVMKERCLDKISSTRANAVQALFRFQDPSNPNCPVTPYFLLLLSHDQSKKVRTQVLNSIIISRKTIDSIIERTRDINEEVRRLTFKIFAEKLSIRNLKSDQAIKLLSAGLTDRDETVRENCKTLVCNWFENCNGDMMKFLKYLCIEENEEIAEQTLISLFRSDAFLKNQAKKENTTSFQSMMEKFIERTSKSAPFEISNEMAFLWRVYCKANEEDVEQNIENYLPEASKFCALIQYHHQLNLKTNDNEDEEEEEEEERPRSNRNTEFVLMQLLKLTRQLDMSDEVGRKFLSLLLRDMSISPDTPHSLVTEVLKVIKTLHRNVREISQLILEVIATVREPLVQIDSPEQAQMIEQMQQKLSLLEMEFKSLKQKKKTKALPSDQRKTITKRMETIQQEAQPIESQLDLIDRLREYVYLRSLTATLVLFEHSEILPLQTISKIEEEIILPSLDSGSSAVRTAALECLLHVCLQSKDKAKEKVGIFVESLNSEDCEFDVKKISLSALFDLCVYYGLEEMEIGYLSYDNGDEDEKEKGSDDDDDEEKEVKKGNNVVIKSLIQHLDYDGETNYQIQLKKLNAEEKKLNDYSDIIDFDDETENEEVLKEKEILRTLSVEGLTKLYLLQSMDHSHLYFDRILLQLILLFHSPDSQQQFTIRQCLSVFFTAFYSPKSSNSPSESFLENQKMNLNSIEKIFMPVMKILFQNNSHHSNSTKQKGHSSTSSAILNIKYAAMGSFLLSLTQPSAKLDSDDQLNEHRKEIHRKISISIASELYSKNDYGTQDLKSLVSLLSNCSLADSPVAHLSKLNDHINKAIMAIHDRMTLTALKKFKDNMTSLIQSHSSSSSSSSSTTKKSVNKKNNKKVNNNRDEDNEEEKGEEEEKETNSLANSMSRLAVSKAKKPVKKNNKKVNNNRDEDSEEEEKKEEEEEEEEAKSLVNSMSRLAVSQAKKPVKKQVVKEDDDDDENSDNNNNSDESEEDETKSLTGKMKKLAVTNTKTKVLSDKQAKKKDAAALDNLMKKKTTSKTTAKASKAKENISDPPIDAPKRRGRPPKAKN